MGIFWGKDGTELHCKSCRLAAQSFTVHFVRSSLSLICLYPLISVLIRSNPFLSVLIHLFPFLSILIRFHPFLSVLIRSHPFSSVRIRPYPFLSVLVRLNPFHYKGGSIQPRISYCVDTIY